jgi:23S rRNA-/tRNA-specific pseudouridylate synthase
MVPCVIFEDEHLLAVHKPAGWNTHGPGPYAGEGVYDWLRAREPRWATLAIIHRLDKETSGILVFGKTSLANKSLTEQFTERRRDSRNKIYFYRGRQICGGKRGIKNGQGGTAHGPHSPNPGSRCGERISHPGRYPLWRHGFLTRFLACRRD